MRLATFLLLACLTLALLEAKKKPKKKPKGKGNIKGECKTKGPAPSPKIFAKYTEKNKKCPCWWDLTRNDCACCKKKEYMQCGYPMHEYCYKKAKKGQVQMGCPGVCNNEFTLSGMGFPCFSDHDNKDCAWCTTKGYQCAQDKVTGPQSKQGSRCTKIRNKNYCKNQQGDCKHIPACDINAECKFKEKLSKYYSYWRCVCKAPYKGNGIQCFDKDGNISLPPALGVEVSMSITSEEYTYPFTGGEFIEGEIMEALQEEMGTVAGNVCPKENCQSTYNQTEQNN